MKKKFLGLILVLIISMAFFTGCSSLSDAEKEVVGKYELTEISIVGYPLVTKDSYDYFTMEFLSNRKCVIKSKAGITEAEGTASWKINSDGEIEVITKQGLAKATEKYILEGNILSGTNTGFVDGAQITMTIKMEKVEQQ